MSPKRISTDEALELYGSLVLKIIWNLVPITDDASDVFQDTFLQYQLALTSGRQIHNQKAWLCTTARNGAFKQRRLRQRQAIPVAQEVLDTHPAKSNNPDTTLLLDQIRGLAAQLPDRQGQVFIMRNFDLMSYAEIADHLDCTEEAARASGYKALKKVRSLMGKRQEDSHV